MSYQEQYEMRQVLDDIRLRWRDFEVDETKPSRLRASFFGYVVGPAVLFGFLTGVLAASMLTIMAIILTYIVGETAQESFNAIIASGTAACAAVVMAYASVLLIDDWRDLQWETKTRRYLGEPKREQPMARYFDQTNENQIVGSSIGWHLRWKEILARRVYDERGQWIGGPKAIRDKHFDKQNDGTPNLYVNITGNWEEARKYLVKIGYIDNVNDCNWTEKAKGELLARLRIV